MIHLYFLFLLCICICICRFNPCPHCCHRCCNNHNNSLGMIIISTNFASTMIFVIVYPSACINPCQPLSLSPSLLSLFLFCFFLSLFLYLLVFKLEREKIDYVARVVCVLNKIGDLSKHTHTYHCVSSVVFVVVVVVSLIIISIVYRCCHHHHHHHHHHRRRCHRFCFPFSYHSF